jgi:chromosome segregation ATPase
VRYAFAPWHPIIGGGHVSDPKKIQEISRKIQEISRSVQSHQSNIDRIEREKNDKTRYYDQQITRERDEIKRLDRQIEDLKRQL